LVAIAACAFAAPAILARRGLHARRVALALFVVLLTLFTTRRVASALNTDARAAHAIERGAPLGKLALGALRRATDRDRDAASPLFAGGDCNDRDPSISPNAFDVPGNGVDEDCTGSDVVLATDDDWPEVDAPREPELPPDHAPLIDRDLNVVFIT